MQTQTHATATIVTSMPRAQEVISAIRTCVDVNQVTKEMENTANVSCPNFSNMTLEQNTLICMMIKKQWRKQEEQGHEPKTLLSHFAQPLLH